MYIGSLGDGANENDGIYILLKEGVDNSVRNEVYAIDFGEDAEGAARLISEYIESSERQWDVHMQNINDKEEN